MYNHVSEYYKSRNSIIKFNPKHPYEHVSRQVIIDGVFRGDNQNEHIIPAFSILNDEDLRDVELRGITLSRVGLEIGRAHV